MVFVALAGIVRKRYSVFAGPIWNLYSVPGVRPVSSQRWTLRSVLVYGFVTIFFVCQVSLASGVQRMDASAAASVPTHCTVIVVVGSCCQVRNSESSGLLLTSGSLAALAALPLAAFSWLSKPGP